MRSKPFHSSSGWSERSSAKRASASSSRVSSRSTFGSGRRRGVAGSRAAISRRCALRRSRRSRAERWLRSRAAHPPATAATAAAGTAPRALGDQRDRGHGLEPLGAGVGGDGGWFFGDDRIHGNVLGSGGGEGGGRARGQRVVRGGVEDAGPAAVVDVRAGPDRGDLTVG